MFLTSKTDKYSLNGKINLFKSFRNFRLCCIGNYIFFRIRELRYQKLLYVKTARYCILKFHIFILLCYIQNNNRTILQGFLSVNFRDTRVQKQALLSHYGQPYNAGETYDEFSFLPKFYKHTTF